MSPIAGHSQKQEYQNEPRARRPQYHEGPFPIRTPHVFHRNSNLYPEPLKQTEKKFFNNGYVFNKWLWLVVAVIFIFLVCRLITWPPF